MGILDLGSNNEVVFRKDTKFYVLDSKVESQRRVEMHTVLVERGLSWEKALEMYKKTQLETTTSMDENIENEGGKQRPQGFYISNQVKNNHRVAILAVAFVPVLPPGLISKEDPKGGDCSFLAIYRPNTGLQVRQETPESLLKKYKRVNWNFFCSLEFIQLFNGPPILRKSVFIFYEIFFRKIGYFKKSIGKFNK